MKKRLIALLLCAVLMLSGCTAQEETLERYTYSFFGTFDTFIVLTGYTNDKAAFDKAAALCESEFRRYHALFDPYTHNDETNNVFELNNGAWKAPMPVEADMMELLTFCRDKQREYPETVDIAMGRVLRLWHTAREDAEYDPLNAYLPDMEALREASTHSSMDDLILDAEAMTVYYADPLLRIDLGAVAKGFAAGKVAAKIAPLVPRFSLNAGGNIVVGDAPGKAIGQWKAGVQDPAKALISDDITTLYTIELANTAIVTSGDYQRFFVVGDTRYHHIIDPVTLMPANHVRAVTILYQDSAMADFLSTAAFILPYPDSRTMIESIPGAEALWVLPDGSVQMTEGFRAKGIEP